MKYRLLIFITSTIIILITGCNFSFADDAARSADDLARSADDLARSADDLARSADDLARSADDLARSADDLARSDESAAYRAVSGVLSTEADNAINKLVKNLTPEQKEKLKGTFISSSCWYLLSSYEGNVPNEEQIASHISRKLVKKFLFEDSDDLEELIDLGIDYVKSTSKSIQDQGADRDSVTSYCDLLE